MVYLHSDIMESFPSIMVVVIITKIIVTLIIRLIITLTIIKRIIIIKMMENR